MSEHSMKVPNFAGWDEQVLREICSTVSRGTAPIYVEHSPIRAIGQRCVQNSGFDVSFARLHDKRATRVLRAQQGDVLLNSTGTGTIGRSCIFNDLGDFMVDGHVTVLRVEPSCADPRWINSLLRSQWGQKHLESHCYTGSTNQMELSRKELERTSVPVPPLVEQRRIAEILDALDTQIAHTERTISKSQEVKKGLLSELSSNYFSEGEHSTLGELGELITSGSRGWAEYYSDDGALFVRIGNLTREHINLRLTGKVFVRPPATSDGKRTSLHRDDVLISITADLGIIGVVPDGLGDAYVNQHIALVRLSPIVNPRWVGHMLASRHGQRQFQLGNDSGAKAGLNLPAISRICVPILGRDIEDHLAAMLDEQDARIHRLKGDREKLGLLKQGLMEDLLTGRVRVPEAEAVLEDL
ncbi:restriction endonuclease subunit S [Streptosporangium sp. NBC_01756]|uniref:restriction endonuclease subunit S n=1 Tax=Streptosporangium sp. NBC_01756 TaxID=2975950 RepID=UPI002DDB6EDB|nr:restriction endonuclease subunit S [Streptosporangium sp. NBC_01756]WSC86959.1 restriction endonuclease subunit S [Streptosporangium sp. NBC_01756]